MKRSTSMVMIYTGIVLMAAGVTTIIVHAERWDDHVPLPEEISREDTLYMRVYGDSSSILERTQQYLFELHDFCHTIAEIQGASSEQCHPSEWPYRDSLQVAKR